MNLLNRDFRQMKIAGQHTPFWGGQHGRFLHSNIFSLENTLLFVCDEKVKNILEKQEITNLKFRNL